jgi:hypothetical protein
MKTLKKHGLLDWDFIQPILMLTVMLVIGELV